MNYRFSEQLDQVKLREFYDNDPIVASAVFEAFLQEMATALPNLELLYKNGIPEEFRRLVHKIRPGFLYVGLTSLYDQLDLIEKSCHGLGNLAQIADQVDPLMLKLKVELPWVEAELAKMRVADLPG